jgi:hypothetical protein
MRARAVTAVAAVVAMAAALLLAAGPTALGKEGVTARLLTPLRVDAAPRERLTVVWALAGTDEHGRRQPFNAIGVFVRLLSASGGRPRIGLATPDAHPQGRYDARVAVPAGGIGGVQVGLGGDGGGGDTLFLLENDPFAAPARGAAAGQQAAPDRGVPVWPALAGALALLGVLAAVIWRGRGGLPWRVRRMVDDRGGEAAMSSSQPPSPR